MNHIVTFYRGVRVAEAAIADVALSVDGVESLMSALERLGIGRCSPRVHSAHRRYTDEGIPAQAVLEEAVRHERQARETWVEHALRPWCERHGITLLQGLSIAFDDHPFNPANPAEDQPTLQSLFAWSGQQNYFASRVKAELMAEQGSL